MMGLIDMVRVKLHNVNVTGVERQIAEVLSQSMGSDLDGIACPKCASDSEVILHVDNSRMSTLRTEIRPCCGSFKHKIESRLFEVESA